MLATQEGCESFGYGTAALKVALLYMKEHYLSSNVRVLANTSKDGRDRTGVEFWEIFGFAIIIGNEAVSDSFKVFNGWRLRFQRL